MMKNFDFIVGVAGFTAAILGIGYALGQRKKLDDISQKVEKSIDELSSNVHVDISDVIVDEAINRAVEEKTSFAVKKAVDKVSKEIETDISRQVKTAINDTYSDIRKSVVDETAKKTANIDIQALKSEVVERAKDDVAKKFDNNLNDILEDFNRNLSNVSHIYQSIAQTFPNGKELKLSLA